MTIYLIIAVLIGAVIGFVCGYFIRTILMRNEPKRPITGIDALPKCKCRDVNQCDTWCQVKANFSKYHG
jgi:membrane protein DedA with SNARE-associated domain